MNVEGYKYGALPTKLRERNPPTRDRTWISMFFNKLQILILLFKFCAELPQYATITKQAGIESFKVIFRTISQRWDLNPRTLQGSDLESDAVDHFATLAKICIPEGDVLDLKITYFYLTFFLLIFSAPNFKTSDGTRTHEPMRGQILSLLRLTTSLHQLFFDTKTIQPWSDQTPSVNPIGLTIRSVYNL